MNTVSLIIPVYNTEDSLERCLASVRKQTLRELEILLLDDGSSDRSREICLDAAREDDRIRVLFHKNHGVSFTRNRGIRHASGEYLMFIDSDDEILPDMAERYVKAAEENEADIVLGGIDIVTEAKRERLLPEGEGAVDQRHFWELAAEDTSGLYGYAPNKLYRTRFLKENCLFFREDMKAQEDLDFALRAFTCAKKKILISFSGYSYYYRGGHRKVPPADLMKNQLRLYRQAEAVGVAENTLEKLKERMAHIIYGCLFEAEEEVEIRALSDFQEVKNLINPERLDKKELRQILIWFKAGKTKRILSYFRLRRGVKRLLFKRKR